MRYECWECKKIFSDKEIVKHQQDHVGGLGGGSLHTYNRCTKCYKAYAKRQKQ